MVFLSLFSNSFHLFSFLFSMPTSIKMINHTDERILSKKDLIMKILLNFLRKLLRIIVTRYESKMCTNHSPKMIFVQSLK